ncbi:MFS transporter [Paraphotobacterium marinum]|uniref:MFS transporter n=1 Tax=Paraphotobacterium marinum TaxID=1755811 RepID=A0A220VEY8_9GAMM|nr:MFS transporter [Paraphotobacterium marinum]ASK78925.1 MFS transporter [Paraphotobacterium marinum]
MNNNNVYKVSILSGFGGMLEFYDFILYIIFSSQISATFLQNVQSEIVKNLITVCIFSVAYIVRPIGGLLTGWLGDNIGRKKSFSLTILIMSVCIFLMGVMPSYDQIGVIAPILFIMLRVIQGLALGGELPGAIVFVYESVHKNRGIALGILFGMVFLGFLLGDIMGDLLKHYFGAYAWRVGFISGSAIALVGYFIRSKLHETPMFMALENKQKFPLFHILKNNFSLQLGGIFNAMLVACNGVVVSLYISKYLQNHLNIPYFKFQNIAYAISILNVIIIFLASFLSDFVNVKKMYKLTTILLALMSFPAFYLMSLGQISSIFMGWFMLTILCGIGTGLFMKILCDSFETNVRLTGVAMSYNLAFAFVGGVGPLAIELMIKSINNIAGPSIVCICCALMGYVSIRLTSQKNTNKKLNTQILTDKS